jgi:hypothetical protein
MAATKSFSALWATATTIPAGTLESAPVASPAIDVSTSYGGELTYRITNSGALGSPGILMFQISQNGTDWYDYQPIASKDNLSGTVTPGTISLVRPAMFLRAVAFGNTTNAITVQAGVMLLTGL